MRPMIRQPQGRVIPNKAGFPYPGIGFLMGNDPEDIFGIRRLSYFNSPELVGNSEGLARRFVAAQRAYATVTPPPDLINFSQNFTGVLVFMIDEITVSRVVHYSDGTNNLILTLLGTGHLNMSLGTASGGGAQAGSTLPLKTGVPYTVVFGRELTNGFFMNINGVEQLRGSSAAIANNVASTVIQLGRRSDNSNYFSGQISLFAHIAGRPDAESLSRNPWQLFLEPVDEPIADSGPLNRILAVGAASIALVCGQVGMRVSRRMSVQPAGLSVTAGDILVRASRRLAVDGAALAIDAGQVGMRAARRISIAPAALDLGAGAVSLRAARQLRVTPAGLDLAGGAVGMRATRRLSVAPAALVLTGGQVEMQYSPAQIPGTYTLTVSAAAITLGGGNVGMRVSRRLAVTPAALELAVGAVRVLVGRRLVVAPAALAMSATLVGMRAARRVRVDPTQLALVGGNVQLRYSSQVEYARAPAGAGYAPQRVSAQARPAQTGGHRPPATQEITR